MNDIISSGCRVHSTAAATEGDVASASCAGTGATSLWTVVATAGGARAAGGAEEAVSGTEGAAAAQHAQGPDPGSTEVQLQRLSELFFGGKARPTNNDLDFPRMAPPRAQRHTELTETEVKIAVQAVLQTFKKRIPLPSKDGSLRRAKVKGGPLDGWTNGLLGARVELEDSSVRARRCRGSGAWTAASKALARLHHLVTGTAIFMMPEVFDREVLLRAEGFQVIKGGKAVGVRLPCPVCRSNGHTTWCSWSDVRAIHGTSGENTFLVPSRRKCLNPECEAVKRGSIAAMMKRDSVGEAMVTDKKNEPPDIVDKAPDAVKEALRRGDVGNCMSAATVLLNGGVSFTVSDSRFMEMLPPCVQAKYDFECFSKGAASRALLDLTVALAWPVAALQRQVMEAYHYQQGLKHTRWSTFAASEKDGGIFPELGVVGSGTLLSFPSKAYLETYCSQAFLKVKPLLRREICNRSPGKSLSLDATFRLAKMSTGHANCIVFILGEFGHIVSWAALRSDKWSNVLPVLFALRKRLERLGTLDDVQRVFADTCCEGMSDVSAHVCVDLFPNVTRAPFADPRHKVQIFSSQTLSSHPLHAPMTREVGKCTAKKHEADLHRVAASVVRSRGWTAERAMGAALSKRYSRHIRTFTPANCAELLEGVFQKYLKLSQEAERGGERPLFQEKMGASQSLLSAFQHVVGCAKKGCFSVDAAQDTYVCDKIGEKTGLPHWKKLEGTGASEAARSKGNKRVAGLASRMSDARTEREIWLRVREHNRTIDENRGIAKPDFLRHFWEEERLSLQTRNLEGPTPGGNLMMPPELRDQDVERMGFECLALDHDEVALEIARERRMDFSHLRASSLPAVAVEEPWQGPNELDYEDYEAQAQTGMELVGSCAEPSSGRTGGRSRECLGEGVDDRSSGFGSGGLEGIDGRSSARPSEASSMAFSPSLGNRPAAALRAAAAKNLLDLRKARGATWDGLAEQDPPPGGTHAGESQPGWRANSPSAEIEASSSSSGSATHRAAAGPKDGQGRAPKYRKTMALSERFSKPTTKDEEKLASESFATAMAQGLQGERVWEAAAKFYNSSLNRSLQEIRDSGRPSILEYKYHPIDGALLKEYWEELWAATVVQRAGAEGLLVPQVVACGAGENTGAMGGGASVPPTRLRYNDIKGWSGNKLKVACRHRKIGVANTTHRSAAIQKLINAGWVEM